LNNAAVGAGNASVTIELADIRYPLTATGETTVFDVWQEKSVATLPAGASSFTTDAFSGHDSRFYVFLPKP
jgi:hypothetical protein